jgi:hypothetical protein
VAQKTDYNILISLHFAQRTVMAHEMLMEQLPRLRVFWGRQLSGAAAITAAHDTKIQERIIGESKTWNSIALKR